MYLTIAKSKENSFKPVPQGTHLGRMYRIVDIGTQQGEWQGKITNQRKIILYFELFGEDETGAPLVRDDGKPLIITKYYNRSLNEKSTFRKHLQSWLKIDFDTVEGFNLEDLLGKFAMVSVSNYKGKNGDIKASVDGLAAVPSMLSKHGMPDGVNPNFIFNLDKFDSEKFAGLSEGIQSMIKLSPEYRRLAGLEDKQEKPQEKPQAKPAKQEYAGEDDMNDDIPF